MPIDHLIIQTYIIVDDFLKSYGKIRKRGPQPNLSDAEAITIELVGELQGRSSDKGIFDYFKHHWQDWFPQLTCRTTFITQIANLWKVKEEIRRHLVKEMDPNVDLFLFDGFPIPTCHPKRVRSRNPFQGIGSFGYCAAKDKKYFGFKGHLLTNQKGLIIDFALTPANVDERDVLPELVQKWRGDIIADKGLIRPELTESLANQGLKLHTPLRANMKDNRPKEFVNQIMNVRRLIETGIGQLVERFKIQSIRTKNAWHIAAKVGRKILAHTLACLLAGSLEFDTLLAKP